MIDYQAARNLTARHLNSGLDVDGAINFFDAGQYDRQRRMETEPRREWFDSMWNQLHGMIQDPVQDEGPERFSGYTGHRIVTLAGRMGRCALGFHLLKVGCNEYRTITAFRRKIYASERRRQYYTSDSLCISSSVIFSSEYSPKHEHDMGVMASWIDSYESAAKLDIE